MMKKIKQAKGFAMAELLAVCVVIMLLFSILFSNYLPILSEYENRLDYNNVTAEYAGHYLRKIYKTSLGVELKEKLGSTLGSGSYKVMYANGSGNLCDYEGLTDSGKAKCKDVLTHYGIKEVILTKYSTSAVKAE